jgi:hypothetical protein
MISKFKSVALVGVGLLAGTLAFGQGLPKPSPAAEFTQTVGVTEVSMNYSRPGVKERAIWGELVPFGEVWRTGANASTKITFSTDVMINNVEVKAGEYALFVLPTADNWTFIINTHTTGWGVDGYDEKNDVVRVTVTPEAHHFVENMLFETDAVTDNSMKVTLAWEKMAGSFTIETKTKELGTAVVEDMIKEADNSFRKYNDAANWYLKNGDATKAVEMATKSVSQDKRFWNLTVLSECQAAAGDMKAAIKTAEEALALAQEANYAPYVKRNEANIAEWKKMK